MMRDPMEETQPWDVSDETYLDRQTEEACAPPLRVAVNQPLRETPDPLDLTLWTLLREADALTLGLSLGAFHLTRARRDSLGALIQQLQRAELLAIDEGR